MPSELLHRDVPIGVDADVGGDVHRLAYDRLGIERGIDERASGGERVVAAGADAHHAGIGLEHVAGAGEHQRYLRVGNDHHRLEAAQVAARATVLGEVDGGAGELSRILLELAFQPLEQGEGVGGGAGEAPDHVALAEAAHLLGVGLDDGLADGHLPVAADHDAAAFADGQDRRAVPDVGGSGLHASIRIASDLSIAALRRNRSGRWSGAAEQPLIKGARLAAKPKKLRERSCAKARSSAPPRRPTSRSPSISTAAVAPRSRPGSASSTTCSSSWRGILASTSASRPRATCTSINTIPPKTSASPSARR